MEVGGVVMIIRQEMVTWVIGKGGTKRGAEKMGVWRGKGMGAAGFCGPYEC
jgi:hypothetical protein